MNKQEQAQINDISRKIDDLECYIWSIFRGLRVLEKSNDLSANEFIRVYNTRKLCFRLLVELSEF